MTDKRKKRERNLRKETTAKGREIWAMVDKAAAKAPQWMRDKVMKAGRRDD